MKGGWEGWSWIFPCKFAPLSIGVPIGVTESLLPGHEPLRDRVPLRAGHPPPLSQAALPGKQIIPHTGTGVPVKSNLVTGRQELGLDWKAKKTTQYRYLINYKTELVY